MIVFFPDHTHLLFCARKLVPLKLRHLVELVLPRKLSSPSMQSITISVSGVSKQLLKLGKAAGPDNISPRILKELHLVIALILTDIFNTSLSESIVQTIGIMPM